MILTKSKESIVCDIKGCNNLANYFIRKKQADKDFDSIKLCEDCAKKLSKVLNFEFKNKESKNV